MLSMKKSVRSKFTSQTVLGLATVDATAKAANHVATPDSVLTLNVDSCVANGMDRGTAELCLTGAALEAGLFASNEHVPKEWRTWILSGIEPALGDENIQVIKDSWLARQESLDETASTRQTKTKSKRTSSRLAAGGGGAEEETSDGDEDTDAEQYESPSQRLDLALGLFRLQTGQTVEAKQTYSSKVAQIVTDIAYHHRLMAQVVKAAVQQTKDPVAIAAMESTFNASMKEKLENMSDIERATSCYCLPRHIQVNVSKALNRGVLDGTRVLKLRKEMAEARPTGTSATAVTEYSKSFNELNAAHTRASGAEIGTKVLHAMYLEGLDNAKPPIPAVAQRARDKHDDAIRDAAGDASKTPLSLIELQELSASLYAAHHSKKDPNPSADGDEGFETKKKKSNKKKSQEQEDGGVAELANGARNASSSKGSGKGNGSQKKGNNSKTETNRGGGGGKGGSSGGNGDGKSWVEGAECFKCGKKGHIAKTCKVKTTHRSNAAAADDSSSVASDDSQLWSLKSEVEDLKLMIGTLTKHLMNSGDKGFDN